MEDAAGVELELVDVGAALVLPALLLAAAGAVVFEFEFATAGAGFESLLLEVAPAVLDEEPLDEFVEEELVLNDVSAVDFKPDNALSVN